VPSPRGAAARARALPMRSAQAFRRRRWRGCMNRPPISQTGKSAGAARAQGGQAAGGGVRGWALNRSAASLAAVVGGFPLVLAGAFAHHVRGPTLNRTATAPCGGWSSR